jgi:hypothetical protein
MKQLPLSAVVVLVLADRLRVLAHQGARGREGAGELAVEPGGSHALQGARHGAGMLKRRGAAKDTYRHDG